LYTLRKRWNQAKHDVAPWWSDCSKEAFNTGLDQLARGLENWSGSRMGKRAGERIGFPRFKSKHRAVPAVRFTTGVIRIEPDRKHVTLPRLGTIKTHESTRKLERRLAAGTAREIRRQLAYKTQWNGSRLVVADRWFPSSKTCGGCGAVKPKLSRAQRTYTCESCALVLDRDLNAALNLAAVVERHVAGSGPETLTGRGADRKTVPGTAGGEIPAPREEASTPRPPVAGIRRGPASGNGRILEIH
jgi:transposase